MDPIAFDLGWLTVRWYGIMVALAFVAGLWTSSRRAPLSGIKPDQTMDIGPWLIVGAILGARALHVISYWNESYAGKPWTEIFMIHHGGLVYYGGLIGATAAGIFYVRWKRLPVWKMADVLAPSIALGYVFGRIGCLLNGCCYGRTCDLPWAIRFPTEHETHGFAVHPTQMYDALLSLILYAGLAWLYRRKNFDGQVFAIYLLGYAITRSIVELFRGDYTAAHLRWGLTPAHLVSIGIFVAGLILWTLLRRTAPAPATK